MLCLCATLLNPCAALAVYLRLTGSSHPRSGSSVGPLADLGIASRSVHSRGARYMMDGRVLGHG
jgi:hypothetical protein